MELTPHPRVAMPTAPAKAGRGAGAYGSSPQTAVLGAVVMRGLAAVIRDRRLTSPQMRALLRQPDTADGHLRAELGRDPPLGR